MISLKLWDVDNGMDLSRRKLFRVFCLEQVMTRHHHNGFTQSQIPVIAGREILTQRLGEILPRFPLNLDQIWG